MTRRPSPLAPETFHAFLTQLFPLRLSIIIVDELPGRSRQTKIFIELSISLPFGHRASLINNRERSHAQKSRKLDCELTANRQPHALFINDPERVQSSATQKANCVGVPIRTINHNNIIVGSIIHSASLHVLLNVPS